MSGVDKNGNYAYKKSPLSDIAEAMTAAVCISSVALYGTASALGLALSVLAGVLAAWAVRALIRSDGGTYPSLLSSSVALSSAYVTTAILGISGLERGVFSASAVAVALILGRMSDGQAMGAKDTFKNTAKGIVFYSSAVLFAGAVCELLGAGRIFGMSVPMAGDGYIGVLNSPAGSMTVCAMVSAVVRYVMNRKKEVNSDDGQR